jgi:hypothetical protein
MNPMEAKKMNKKSEKKSGNPGYSIVVQLKKKALAKIATASYGKTYPSKLKGSFSKRGVGSIGYDIQLGNPTVSHNPTKPPEIARYKNSIKIENPARGHIVLPGTKPIRVQFKFYRVVTPKISGDNLVLQFKKVGITDFSPSGRGLNQRLKERVRATADEIIKRETKGQFKIIPLFPIKFPLTIGGITFEIEIKDIDVLRDLLVVSIINGVHGNIDVKTEYTNGWDFAFCIDGAKVLEIFYTCWNNGVIPRRFERDGVTVKIKRIDIAVGSGFLKISADGKAKKGSVPYIPFDLDADITLSIDPKTNTLNIGVHNVDVDVESWAYLLAAAFGFFLAGMFGSIFLLILTEICIGAVEDAIEDVKLSFPVLILDEKLADILKVVAKFTEVEIFNDGTTNGMIFRGNVDISFV